MKFRKNFRTGAALLLGAAMVATVGVNAASTTADAAQASVSSETNWTIPTTPMTNVVKKADGKSYKVITTWANAWATSGPDYLGISNSGTLDQNGGSSTRATSYDKAKTDSLMGVWASAANEVPNAYNWNFLYNLYAASDAGVAAGAQKADFAAIDVTNQASPGYDSESGVWAPLKYRPEILYPSNSFKVDAINKYVGQIQNGEYYTSADTQVTGDDVANYKQTNGSGRNVKAWGDDSQYSPKITTLNNSNPYTFVNSFYTLATLANQVEEETANYTSSDSNTSWKTVNTLPRTTRYESTGAENKYTPTENATNIEKVVRGSVYYTLAKINDGTANRKKVAFLIADPNEDESTATVIAYDFVEDMAGAGQCGGTVGFAALTVDQLTTGTVVNHGGDNVTTGTGSEGDTPYTTYTATADQLADCDYIVDTSAGIRASEYTSEKLKNWVVNHATTQELKNKANAANYMVQIPTAIQTHNYTSEKLMWNAYMVNFFYPELFPNDELLYYWFDDIYHLKTAYVSQVLGWVLANADQPAGTDLSNPSYTLSDMNAKFAYGYQYYAANKSSDTTIKRILAGQPLSTSYYASGADAKTFSSFASLFAPTSEYRAWATDYADANASAVNALKPVTKTTKTTKVSKPAKVTGLKVKAGKKKITVSYKKVKGAKGYQIYYKVAGKKAKTVKTTAVKKTIKKLTSKKKVTVKVRAYKKASGKTYYGSYSAKKTVKVK